MENFEQASSEREEGAKLKRANQQQKNVLSYLHDVVFGLVAVLLIFMLVCRVVIVSGPSMQQTLQNGDALLLLSNVFYNNPKYGDIIVASKDSFKEGEPIVKRIIATEGQTVDIDFNEGIVYVDGKALNEPYTNTPTNLPEGVTFPMTVSEGCVFVMGDNRNDSWDSRSHDIGLIDRRQIIGRVIFVLFPGADADTQKRNFTRIGVPS